MKKTIQILIISILCGLAEMPAQPVELTDVSIDHSDSIVLVSFTVDASTLNLKSNEEVLVTPILRFSDGCIKPFTPVLFAGHNRMVQARRTLKTGENIILASPNSAIGCSEKFPYENGMDSGSLFATVEKRGCCRKAGSELLTPERPYAFAPAAVFSPIFVFSTPAEEGPKLRDLSGKAFIDFRVNRTDIDPAYRQNPRELAIINATVDSVVNDADVTLKSISFTGYASPEGSFANNRRLAEGRTKAVSDYVRERYDFPRSAMISKSIPEDWDGLRLAVAHSTFPNKEQILEVIDDESLLPDARDKRLASRFPSEYKVILRDIYPALRHCDYTINYEVVAYDDPAKILQLAATAPHKLSLREMFVGARTLEPGSEQYCRIFETAAHMYPDSEVANLNAAVSELQRGDLAQARYFLSRAGHSPLSVYTMGVLEGLEGNYEEALKYLREAQKLGVKEAEDALSQIGTLSNLQH